MLVRVLIIGKSDGQFRFGGGCPQLFTEVDWFRDDGNDPDYAFSTEKGRENIITFIKKKRYFNPTLAYLVLHPTNSFTINYKAD